MKFSTHLPALLSSFALLTPALTLEAQEPLAVGSEFQVNTATPDSQRYAAVATDPLGNFVVTWETYNETTEESEIRAQRFASDGARLGIEFQVNEFTTGQQTEPDVGVGPNGGFIIVWASEGGEPGTQLWSIQAQRFAADGTRLGDAFLVNSYTTNSQEEPSVGMDASGGFVVAFKSRGSTGDDTHFDSIQARRFAADGSTLGDQFQVNSYPTSFQTDPTIAVGPDGAFAVTWESRGSAGSDTADQSVQARAFAANNSPRSEDIQVNTYAAGSQNNPAVAMDDSGAFLVVWDGPGAGDGSGIHGRQFNSDGSPGGGSFLINSFPTSSQSNPAVAKAGAGDFVVTWQVNSDGSEPDDGIRGRAFASDGSALGSDFAVNTYTTGDQMKPTLAIDGAGDFVVAWESNGSSGDDTSYKSTQAQRYRVTGTLGDRVWLDTDLDGVQDEGEFGVPNVRVNLLDDLSMLVDWTLTDEEGFYLFKASPGDYFLSFEAPAVYIFTTQDQGHDEAADSDADPVTGETVEFNVQIGVDTTDWDAGLVQNPDLLFADSFESGNLTAWSSSVPSS